MGEQQMLQNEKTRGGASPYQSQLQHFALSRPQISEADTQSPF
jgi:hypothetical protein